jgi:membrane-associated phospholipid phosphatase
VTGEIVASLVPQSIRIKYGPARPVSCRDAAVAFAGGKGLPFMLVGLVFALNLVETLYESRRAVAVTSRGLELASGMHWLEGRSIFENHDVSNVVAVYGFSTAYFFVFPLLVLLMGVALARRSDGRAFRVFATALAIEYACSLPFFLLFPVPERWTYPDANAILLSDLWNSHLIELFRPISALDNCFPSFHTSLSVLVVLCGFVYRVRFRFVAVPLAAMVLLSTYSLGIHWIGDIAAGAALGVISMAAAHRLTERTTRPTTAD